jgi:hypothetical protein
LAAVPTQLHVNPHNSNINPISNFVPWRYFDDLEGDASCNDNVRKISRKVMVMEATAHSCVEVGGIVDAVYRRCVYKTERGKEWSLLL